mmetsp:Transcript_72189/g.193032  ORF Transcript_72189/g.193032 Transcript_72189/m.193032 type:complete len:125 (-) Transcript_72189:1630-2004(-)
MQAAVAKHWLRHERRCFGGGRGQSEANTLLQQLAREPCVCREVSQGGGVMGETSERRQAKDVFEVEVAHEEDDDDQDAADADAAGAEPAAAPQPRAHPAAARDARLSGADARSGGHLRQHSLHV